MCNILVVCNYMKYILSRNLMSFSTIYIYRFTCVYDVVLVRKGDPNQTWWFENKLIFRPWNAFLRLKPNSGTFYCSAFEAWLLQPYPIIIPCKNAWLEDDSFNFLLKWFLFRFSCLFMCRGYMKIRFTFSGQAKPYGHDMQRRQKRSLSLEPS